MDNNKNFQNTSDLMVEFPVAFIKSMSMTTSIQGVLDIASYWISSMVEADRASVTLVDLTGLTGQDCLKIYSLQGAQAIPLHTVIPVKGTFIGECFTKRRVMWGRLEATSEALNEQVLCEAGLKSYVSAPLISGDRCYGTLNVAHNTENYYSDVHGLIVESMAAWLASQVRILDKMKKNQILANTDFLTGLLNRRSFMDSATECFQHFQLAKKSFALALLDVDFFKVINDSYGHDTGDLVLKEIAGALKSQVRGGDLVARFGGEEFIILFDAIDKDKFVRLVNNCKKSMTAIQVSCPDRVIDIGLSVGLTYSIAADNSLEAIVKRADKLLYRAKQRGRKQVQSDVCVSVDFETETL